MPFLMASIQAQDKLKPSKYSGKIIIPSKSSHNNEKVTTNRTKNYLIVIKIYLAYLKWYLKRKPFFFANVDNIN